MGCGVQNFLLVGCEGLSVDKDTHFYLVLGHRFISGAVSWNLVIW